jgi:hypothetical protein
MKRGDVDLLCRDVGLKYGNVDLLYDDSDWLFGLFYRLFRIEGPPDEILSDGSGITATD